MKQLSAGDLEEALGAANAIGDDRLQKQAQGRVVPDSFTHGSFRAEDARVQARLRLGNPKDCSD
jgi:predicted metalloprotease